MSIALSQRMFTTMQITLGGMKVAYVGILFNFFNMLSLYTAGLVVHILQTLGLI